MATEISQIIFMFFQIKYLKLVALIDVAALGLVIAVTLLALHGDVRLTFVGVFCAALTLGMYASPLSVMVIIFYQAYVFCY